MCQTEGKDREKVMIVWHKKPNEENNYFKILIYMVYFTYFSSQTNFKLNS